MVQLADYQEKLLFELENRKTKKPGKPLTLL
jgi:hypothetical protein